MWKESLPRVKATFPRLAVVIIVLLLSLLPASAQYYLSNQKDNTHPENNISQARPAFITSFSATHWNGYNEITWTAALQQDSRRFIVEYSVNGIDFQTAGEVVCNNATTYTLKHTLLDDRPMLYRVKTESLSGLFFYSPPVLLDGVPVLPVDIYPTIVTGNAINVIADLSVERIIITSTNGKQLYVKETGGQTGKITVIIPALSKGMYWMTFYGQGWKSSSRFMIP